MGRRYSIDGARNVSAAAPTHLTLKTNATTIRPAWYDIMFGSTASPSDVAYQWLVQRHTAEGTPNAAVTPQALDPNDPGATALGGEGHSAEPTYTANAILLNIPANKRSTQRWVASPGGNLIMPATAASGLGLQCIHSSDTGQVQATVHYEE
jgi:hypothetical protein